MKILDSALRHGYTLAELENMIEVFMSDEDETIFHAMKLSKTIEALIHKGD